MDWEVKAGPGTGRTGVATDTIAATEMRKASAAKPKQNSTSGRVRTRRRTAVRLFKMLM